jgi:thiol-disulfide isomerase/thioredoxin
MRRRILTVFAVLLFCTYCFSQPIKFSLRGHLTNPSNSEKFFLQGEINEEVALENNRDFSFTGSLPKPGFLLIKTDNSYAWKIWIDEGNIELAVEEYLPADMDKNGKKLLRINSIKGPLETEKGESFIQYQNHLANRFKRLPKDQRNDSIVHYYYAALENYISQYPNSKLFPHLINSFYFDEHRKAQLLAMVKSETDPEQVKRVERSIARDKLLKKGNKIANFKQNRLDGKPFSLNSLTSPYVLLEFWSSDCPPCRKDNPKLITVYNDYHAKGFEVVGVSLDKSKGDWSKAVTKDKLPWINVSDLKGWHNALAVEYLVDAIPFNILIDKNRHVVATDLSPETLSQKLEELLKK